MYGLRLLGLVGLWVWISKEWRNGLLGLLGAIIGIHSPFPTKNQGEEGRQSEFGASLMEPL